MSCRSVERMRTRLLPWLLLGAVGCGRFGKGCQDARELERARAEQALSEQAEQAELAMQTGGKEVEVPMSEPRVAEELSLLKTLRSLRVRHAGVTTPPDAALEAHERYVSRLLAAARAGTEPPSAPEGLRLQVHPKTGLWLLHEPKGDARGAGCLVLRPGSARELVLQAPHSYFDRETLEIALRQFALVRARALQFNTTHRAAGVKSKAARMRLVSEGEAGSDVAHLPRSVFNATHRALLAGVVDPVVVQLHGFSGDRVPGYDAVVSAARTRGLPADRLADALSKEFEGYPVAAYPRDVRDLGGTHNQQARSAFGRRFLHVEMSSRLRDALATKAALQAGLARWLIALSEAPEAR